MSQTDYNTGRAAGDILGQRCREQQQRIEEIERIRAGVRVSLIAMRTAVKKGGSVSEEQLKDLIDELEAK